MTSLAAFRGPFGGSFGGSFGGIASLLNTTTGVPMPTMNWEVEMMTLAVRASQGSYW